MYEPMEGRTMEWNCTKCVLSNGRKNHGSWKLYQMCMKQWKEKKPWNGIAPNVYEAMKRKNHGMEVVPNVMFMHKK